MKKFFFKTFCVEIKNFSKIQTQAYNGAQFTDAPDFEVQPIDGFTLVDVISLEGKLQFFVKVDDKFYISKEIKSSDKDDERFRLDFLMIYLPISYDKNHLVIDDNDLTEVSNDEFYEKIKSLREN